MVLINEEATASVVAGSPTRVKNQWLLSSFREMAVDGWFWMGAARAGKEKKSRRRMRSFREPVYATGPAPRWCGLLRLIYTLLAIFELE